MIYKQQPDQAVVYVIYLAYARCDSNFKGAARTGGSLLSCEHFIIMNYEL